MGNDLRNLVVATASALFVSAVVWYFAQYAVAQIGVSFGSNALLAYLPGWALLFEQLLPGFIVGLLATRWQSVAGALVSYAFPLGTYYFATQHWGTFGLRDLLLGKALLSAAYGFVSALAGCYVHQRMRAKDSLKRTGA